MNGNGTKIIWGIFASLVVAGIISLAALFDRVGRLEASLGSASEARLITSSLVRLQGEVEALQSFRGEGRRFTYEDGIAIRQDLPAVDQRVRVLEIRRGR